MTMRPSKLPHRNERSIPIHEARALLSDCVGRMVQEPELGHGSFVTMYLVNQDLRGPEEYFVWIYCTAWNLCSDCDLLCGSEDDREFMDETLRQLDGQIVERITIDHPSLSLSLEVTGGLRLQTLSIYSAHSDNYEHWFVKLPSGEWLVAGPGHELFLQPADV